jgi:hypothetical protein
MLFLLNPKLLINGLTHLGLAITMVSASGAAVRRTTRAVSSARCKRNNFICPLLRFIRNFNRSAIELLIESGFKPSRTIVLAFGFDEETSGLEGANKLADAMLDIYGENAFDFIIDEGGTLSNDTKS